MKAEETRKKHDTFIYKKFKTEIDRDYLNLSFEFQITPNLEFNPNVQIPLSQIPDLSEINNFAFHLGLIEAISYWKSTCSPKIILEAGYLTPEQIQWWHDLFIHGLGEFYFRNQINFQEPNFLNIESSAVAPHYSLVDLKKPKGNLILVGGGKDSALTLEILKKQNSHQGIMLLNPFQAALSVSGLSGIDKPLIIKRTLDSRLLKLNKAGYLNGHTPFSAYLAFLGVLVSVLHGYEYVIASNEHSAAEGNVTYLGLEINHQYSKSWRFEKLFREYADAFLSANVKYFSFLRPLSELQIAALFSRTEKYDRAFSSCNINRNNGWCGKCPKCAFVYLALSPFLELQRIRSIFGPVDLFNQSSIQEHIKALVGLSEYKPFECVGTIKESRLAVALTIFKFRRQGYPVHHFLLDLDKQLNLTSKTTESELLRQVKSDWSNENFLPSEYANLLQTELNSLNL